MLPFPPRRILCASDLSDSADEAIRQSERWSRRHGSDLLLVHVIPDPVRSYPFFPSAIAPATRRSSPISFRKPGACFPSEPPRWRSAHREEAGEVEQRGGRREIQHTRISLASQPYSPSPRKLTSQGDDPLGLARGPSTAVFVWRGQMPHRDPMPRKGMPWLAPLAATQNGSGLRSGRRVAAPDTSSAGDRTAYRAPRPRDARPPREPPDRRTTRSI